MGRLILVNFAIGAVGTPVAADFKTTEGIRVILPSPSVIKPVSSSRVGIAVLSDVELELPAIAKYITVAAYAGADSPRVDYIASDGSLVASHVTAKGADQLVQDGVSGHAPVARLILRGFDGEGILLNLAALIEDEQEKATALDDLSTLAVDSVICQAIVYGESGTIELLKGSDAPGLAEARRFIAGVAYKRSGQGLAKPKYPTADELKQPFIKKAWELCKTAADDAVSDDVKTCKHFVIWYSDDDGKTPSKSPKPIQDPWPYDQVDKITAHWGPYKVNELGKSNIFVIKYCGVP